MFIHHTKAVFVWRLPHWWVLRVSNFRFRCGDRELFRLTKSKSSPSPKVFQGYQEVLRIMRVYSCQNIIHFLQEVLSFHGFGKGFWLFATWRDKIFEDLIAWLRSDSLEEKASPSLPRCWDPISLKDLLFCWDPLWHQANSASSLRPVRDVRARTQNMAILIRFSPLGPWPSQVLQWFVKNLRPREMSTVRLFGLCRCQSVIIDLHGMPICQT